MKHLKSAFHVHSFGTKIPINRITSSASGPVLGLRLLSQPVEHLRPISLPTKPPLLGASMVGTAQKPLMGPVTHQEWETYLASNPPPTGIRLVLRKPRAAQIVTGITYPEALDVALCYGWIDSQSSRHPTDPINYQVRVFTPRRARSQWSQINRQHVERLISEGRMQAEGLEEVERAKADGRWEAAYRIRGAEADGAFAEALEGRPAAKAFWKGLGRGKRWAFLFRLNGIKTEETRKRRITEFVNMLERGETLS